MNDSDAGNDEVALRRRERAAEWLHERTAHRSALEWWRDRDVPGGASWWNATGPVCLGLFLVVLATGLFLMLGYVPDAEDGWSSVHHIETTPGGSLLRGLHYYGTHLLIVAFAAHLVRLLLMASFRAPRELAWVSGVLIVPLLAAAAVTGNPLSASQKAFEQIAVESNIVGATPVVGPTARTVLLGGSQAGSLTLTHLYALHVAFLPLAAAGVMGFHLYQLLRWGTVRHEDLRPSKRERVDPYFPDQMLRNAAAFCAVFGLAWYMAATVGAPLDVPADPEIESVPRPEWYFLFLFEARTLVPPHLEFLATGLFPALVLGLLVALPWIDRLGMKIGAAVRYATVLGGGLLWCGLTLSAMERDRGDEHLRAVRRENAVLADRAAFLASANGVPPGGPSLLLRTDPKTRGPVLFARHCANCHRHVGPDGTGVEATARVAAANLHGFGGEAWAAGMLDPDRVDTPEYFGATPFADGDMVQYVKTTLWDIDRDDPEAVAELRGRIRAVAAALASESDLPPGPDDVTPPDPALAARGRELMAGDLGCTDCHNFGDAEDGYACDLNGYASRVWLAEFIANPAHPRFYGDENAMPLYSPGPPGDDANLLTKEEVVLIADWLRGDWPEP